MANDVFSPKERLTRVLQKDKVDRPPVICPGGMMNAAIVDVMKKNDHVFPTAHFTAEKMSALAYDVHRYTGFENIGIPFCMTVEAEVLGSEINFGNLECEPKIQKELFASTSEVDFRPPGSMEKSSRVEAVAGTISRLSAKYPDIPVIGSITGPISTAGSIIDPMRFLKDFYKDKQNVHKVLAYVNGHLLEYARLMVENGAAAISIADPTATGEILGGRLFGQYALPYLNQLVDGIHALGVPVIVHICGKLADSKAHCANLHGDALSLDAFVSLKKLKEEYPHLTTMGNISTVMLQTAEERAVVKRTEILVKNGIDILSPACGLSTTTPLRNIVTLTETVKNI